MGFPRLFITAVAALVVAVVVFFILWRTPASPPAASQPNLPVIGARSPLPPAPSVFPPAAAGGTLSTSRQSDAFPGQPLSLEEITNPILETLEGAFGSGQPSGIPVVRQDFSIQTGKSAPPLPRYEDVIKPGAPFLFPPRYVHYIRAIRRIMVLGGAVAEDYYSEITENSDAAAIMERFVDYVLSANNFPPTEREGRRKQLLDGIRYDLRLLAQEYPAGFTRPAASVVERQIALAVRGGVCAAPSSGEKFFGAVFNFIILQAFAQEAGPSIQDAELRAEVDAIYGEAGAGDMAGSAPGESQNPATCGVTKDDFSECYRGKSYNPAPGVNLWAPCCNCSVPVYGYCVPVGCKNLVCKNGNLIWDPATGICGCDLI